MGKAELVGDINAAVSQSRQRLSIEKGQLLEMDVLISGMDVLVRVFKATLCKMQENKSTIAIWMGM